MRSPLIFLFLFPLALAAQTISTSTDTLSVAPDPHPWRVWAGVGLYPQWSMEMGTRWQWFGLSFGVDHPNEQRADVARPRYSASVLGFLPLSDVLSLYGGAGYSYHSYVYTENYSANGFIVHDVNQVHREELTATGGVQVSLWQKLVLGSSYSSETGLTAHIGYRF